MIKSVLIAALTLGTISVASAQEFDGNLGNRYPQVSTHAAPAFTSRNVAQTGNNVIVRNESYIDRASQSFSGGY